MGYIQYCNNDLFRHLKLSIVGKVYTTMIFNLCKAYLLLCLVACQQLCKVHSGIVGLSKYLRLNHRNAWTLDIQKLGTQKVDHLCIDMNQVLHASFRSSRNTEHISAKLFNKLDDILQIAHPVKSLVLAFDGSAPYAKIQVQRSRRRSNPESCLITPGTNFMNNIHDIMLCYVLQRYRKHKLNDVAVFISDGMHAGEGELKIMDWIHNYMPVLQSTATATTATASTNNIAAARRAASVDSVMICGSDSDIIVQALCLNAISPNTAVLQVGSDSDDAICSVPVLHAGILQSIATVQNSLPKPVKHSQIDPSSQQCTNSFSTVDHNSRGSSSNISNTRGSSDSTIGQQQLDNSMLAVDMVVLFAMQGNDYLPKLRAISNKRALHAYAASLLTLPGSMRYLVDIPNKTFNFPVLWKLVEGIDRLSHDLLVPLPVSIPDAVGALHNAIILKQRRLEKVRNAGWSTRLNVTQFLQENLNWEETAVAKEQVRAMHTLNDHTKPPSLYYYTAREGTVSAPSKYEVQFFAEEADCASRSTAALMEVTPALWKATVWLSWIKYSSWQLYPSKKTARKRLAEEVLKTFDPDAYGAYILQKETAKKALREMRRTVAMEARKWGEPQEEQLLSLLSSPEGIGALLEDTASDYAEEQADNELPGLIEEVGEDEGGDGVLGVNEVSAEEYLQYVSESQVLRYLQGLLWTAHMYATGECADLGYTYSACPPMTAYAIKKYLERLVLSIQAQKGLSESNHTAAKTMSELLALYQEDLQRVVVVPQSRRPALTAEATALCVMPKEGVQYLPAALQEHWYWLARSFQQESQSGSDGFSRLSYDAITERLQECFNTVPGNARNPTTDPAVCNMEATTAGGLGDAASPPSWSVLCQPRLLLSRGYRGVYRPQSVHLPLPVAFNTPSQLPAGAALFLSSLSGNLTESSRIEPTTSTAGSWKRRERSGTAMQKAWRRRRATE